MKTKHFIPLRKIQPIKYFFFMTNKWVGTGTGT